MIVMQIASAQLGRSIVKALVAFLLPAFLAAPAYSSVIRIDPIKVEIAAVDKTGSVKVINQGTGAVAFKIYGLRWTQVDGQNRDEPTDALIVSPPLAKLGAGKSQLVRVGLRKGAAPGFYRLIVEEVPEITPSNGVKIALRFSLPVFAAQQRAPDLKAVTWSVNSAGGGKQVVQVRNGGTHYVRIEPADVTAQTGLALDASASFGIVLPGSSMKWTVATASANNQSAQITGGKSGAVLDKHSPGQ